MIWYINCFMLGLLTGSLIQYLVFRRQLRRIVELVHKIREENNL